MVRKMGTLKKDRANKLSVGAIFRDEAAYLDEWLVFHTFIGVDKFYLYNHRSSDNYMEVLKPWIASGRVELRQAVEQKGKNTQILTYMHCLRTSRFSTKWLAFIDLDEFLWSPSRERISDLLEENPRAAALAIRWVLFGSNGHEERPANGQIESFTKCLPIGAVSKDSELAKIAAEKTGRKNTSSGQYFQGKSIINPRRVVTLNAHLPQAYVGKVVAESGRRLPRLRQKLRSVRLEFWSKNTAERIRLNHYWSRSLQELREKVAKRVSHDSVLGASNRPELEVALLDFLNREKELNMVDDFSLLEIWREAKLKRAGYLDLPLSP